MGIVVYFYQIKINQTVMFKSTLKASFLLILGISSVCSCQRGSQGDTKTKAPSSKTTTETPTEEISKIQGAIVFQHNSSKEHLGPKYSLLKDSLVNLCKEEKHFIHILGYYFSDEEAPKGHRNMGIARARNIKKRLSTSIDPEQIKIASMLSLSSETGYWRDCIKFSSGVIDYKEAWVEETSNGIVIYFPSGDVDSFLTDRLISKIDEAANELKNSNRGVNIIGHTDKQDDDILSYEQGRQRADMVLDLFVRSGVNASNLRASSMGATQPKGDNSTESGRAKNRRIEIIYSRNSN